MLDLQPRSLHRGTVFGNVFANELHMMESFESYIKYCKDNPYREEVVYGSKGGTLDLNKMHVPSLEGFCRYMRITINSLYNYMKLDGEWKDVINFMKESIHSITYEGAAAGLLKESITAKKLGLATVIDTNAVEKKIVILSTPDNGRAIAIEDDTDKLEAVFIPTYGLEIQDSNSADK